MIPGASATAGPPDASTLAAAYAEHVAHVVRAYAAAAAAAGYDALALHAGAPALVNRFDDRHHPLSVTPAFAHVAALAEPDAYVILRGDARPRLVRAVVDDYWEAPPPPPPDWVLAPFEVVHVAGATAAELPAGRTAIITRDPEAAPAGDASRVNPPALVAALDAVRTRKTAYERLCLAEATRRAVAGHRRAAALFADAGERGVSELALHLAYLEASAQDDADTPYKNIVALGRHTATLHHVAYDRAAPARAADSLLVDAGALYGGYCSDITRTYARGDAGLFGALVARMDDLQQEICRRIRPGLAYEALHDEAHHLLAALLVELDIAGGRRGSTAALVDRGVTRALFPHGLGHSLGLVTHDVGMRLRPPRADNPFLRNTSEIAVGQVFTIEPGCYIIDALLAPLRADDRAALVDWDAIEALRPFGGVRIEDDVAVVEGGLVNFTRDAFRAAERAAA